MATRDVTHYRMNGNDGDGNDAGNDGNDDDDDVEWNRHQH